MNSYLKILFVLYLLLLFSLLRNFNYLKNVERVILTAEINREEKKNNKNNELDSKEFFLERELFKNIGKIIDFIKDLVYTICYINDSIFTDTSTSTVYVDGVMIC